MATLGHKIRHVIVLALENRSFDHLLGWEFNPGDMPRLSPASYKLKIDPDHSHRGVMWQMLGTRPSRLPARTSPLTMNGFGAAYEAKGGVANNVSRGFTAQYIPVISTLARGFLVCTRWFCSVPGQTWPNRNFLHAATSDGEVDNNVRFYFGSPTIFECIEEAGATWSIYHEGPPQTWCFPALWRNPFRNRFEDHEDLLEDIDNDRLPNYAFVEPDHGVLFREAFDQSNSQHPHNNAKNGRDFSAGEALIHRIYDALRGNPAVFRKTLLVLTYDEHGGFADHVPPPRAVAPDHKGTIFSFEILGPRVPAVLVSPWLPEGAKDERVFDHSVVPRLLRELFAPESAPLTHRDEKCNSLSSIKVLDSPRTTLPKTSPRTAKMTVKLHAKEVAGASAKLARPPRELDDFQQSLVDLTSLVDQALQAEFATPTRKAQRAELSKKLEIARAKPRTFVSEAERQIYIQDVMRRFYRTKP